MIGHKRSLMGDSLNIYWLLMEPSSNIDWKLTRTSSSVAHVSDVRIGLV